jgi:hypothetical protein
MLRNGWKAKVRPDQQKRGGANTSTSLRPATMRKKIMNVLAASALAISAGLFVASPAYATASDCDGIATSGEFSRFRSCIKVVGTDRNVRSITAKFQISNYDCAYGHSQVMIGGQHFDDSPIDGKYCAPKDPMTSKTYVTKKWDMNRNFRRGTKICAKFWMQDARYSGGYHEIGNACVKIG